MLFVAKSKTGNAAAKIIALTLIECIIPFYSVGIAATALFSASMFSW